MDFCLMTLKGVYYLQCQSSKEFYIIIHLPCIIHINQNQANHKDAHVEKRSTTFD